MNYSAASVGVGRTVHSGVGGTSAGAAGAAVGDCIGCADGVAIGNGVAEGDLVIAGNLVTVCEDVSPPQAIATRAMAPENRPRARRFGI